MVRLPAVMPLGSVQDIHSLRILAEASGESLCPLSGRSSVHLQASWAAPDSLALAVLCSSSSCFYLFLL